MDFNDYQDISKDYTIVDIPRGDTDRRLMFFTLCLVSEAGEVADKIYKMIRDDVSLDKEALLAECGDVLWPLSQIVTELDAKLGKVAGKNLWKLEDRTRRGVVSGSGDNR